MSKELTSLEALENIKHYDTRVGLHEDDYKLIETALKRLDVYEDYQIDLEQEDEVEKLLELNGKITYVDKVLDTQERLIRSVSSDEIRILSSVFKSQLAKLRKKLKALEIIKEKRVLIDRLYMAEDLDSYNDYAEICQMYSSYVVGTLTQEEYDLLKEVLL